MKTRPVSVTFCCLAADNIFYTDDPDILVVKNEVREVDRSTLVIENNSMEPLDNF